MTKSETIIRGRKLPDGSWVQIHADGSEAPLEALQSDWATSIALTQEDADYNALMDPDNEPVLSGADRELIEKLPVPKRIRKQLKLSQKQFSERFHIPLGTLRDWERGVRFPDAAARAYLQVIARKPDAVDEALAETAVVTLPKSEKVPSKRVA